MARRLDGFTRAFSDSKIPFLLAEVITDGQGEMVDLTCRYLNGAAAALVNLPAESLTGKRFSRLFPAERLRDLRPLQAVAFSGSAASFPYTTAMGHALTITCYQPAYGLAACILDPRGRGEQDTAEQMESLLPGAAAVLELSRAGLRCLSFSRQMCRLTGRERGELLERYARDFSALAAPGQWQDLLQALRDAARQGTQVNHDFLLIRGDGSERWVNLRSQILSARGGTVSFFSVLLDVDAAYRDRERLRRAEAALAGAREELQSLLDHLPGGYCLLRQEGDALTLLHLSRGLAELLHDSREELFPRMEADPLFPPAAGGAGGIIRPGGPLPDLRPDPAADLPGPAQRRPECLALPGGRVAAGSRRHQPYLRRLHRRIPGAGGLGGAALPVPAVRIAAGAQPHPAL